MQIGIPTLLARVWIVFTGTLVIPGRALAGWGDESWGSLIWGGAASVPGLGALELTLLAAGLAATAAWTLRKRRPALGLMLTLVLLAIPLAVGAGSVSVLNDFVNGTTADADQVNENFDAVETAVNDNDGRITTAQGTADTAVTNAAAAQGTADTAVTNAAAAQGTADTAVTNAAAAQGTATTAVTNAAAAQGTADTAVTNAAAAQGTADTAVTNAAAAQGTADTAVTNAAAAQGTADTNTAAIGQTTGLEACANGLVVADHDTGLLWEKKTGTVGVAVVCETTPGGCPDPHVVNNQYEWSNSGSDPDGNSFTDFLEKLNDQVFGTADSATDVTGCFAGHCNWRIPSITEIGTIADCSGGAPCVDPVFGPTAPSWYWSASTDFGSPNATWVTSFDLGFMVTLNKTEDTFFRAVRVGSCRY